MHHSIFPGHIDYPLPIIAVGALLLLFGRQLFWLFVAAAGFILGVFAVHSLLPRQDELTTLVIGLVFGVAGALLAIFVQRVAIALAGFLAGGFLAVALSASLLGAAGMSHPPGWIFFLVGGVAGGLLMSAFFGWALIFFSAVHGAHMIVQAVAPMGRGQWDMAKRHQPLMVIGLAALGILFQASTYRKKKPREQ